MQALKQMQTMGLKNAVTSKETAKHTKACVSQQGWLPRGSASLRPARSLEHQTSEYGTQKVLPTSPMKTFAGHQFQKRKPIKEPTRAQSDQGASRAADSAAIVTAMQPATRPSRPSIKLTKLITAVTARTRRANTKRKSKLAEVMAKPKR